MAAATAVAARPIVKFFILLSVDADAVHFYCSAVGLGVAVVAGGAVEHVSGLPSLCAHRCFVINTLPRNSTPAIAESCDFLKMDFWARIARTH
jgi:hypothetical protein